MIDLLRGVKARVYPVGRLDYASEGLLLLTNDGEFAKRITAPPRRTCPRLYLVKTNGPLSAEQEKKFRAGVPLEGKRTAPAELKLIRRADNPWYEVRLIEGRQNQIRLMFKHFGRLVEKLRRVKVGFLELGPLKTGEFRHLTPAELARFRKILKMEEARVNHPRTAPLQPRHRRGRPFQQEIPPFLRRRRIHAARRLPHHSGEPA